MTRKTLLVAAALTSLVLSKSTPAAAAQRMGLAAGVFEVAAASARAVPAFCFDQTAATPESATAFTRVLTDPSKVTVSFGSNSMTLQEALSNSKVSIRGTQASTTRTIQDYRDPAYLQHLPKDQRAHIRKIVQDWDHLSPEERSAIQQIAALHGDFRHVVFVNHTDQPMTIRVASDTVLGGSGDEAPPITSIPPSNDHDTTQHALWKLVTQRQQTWLSEAGFYSGPVDGDASDSFQAGIAFFQDAHGLPITGTVDAETEARLKVAAADQATIRSINKAQVPYLVAQVQTLPHLGIQYRVLSDDGSTIYHGNSAPGLVQSMRDFAKRENVTTVYLVPDGLSHDRVNALSFSMDNVSAANGEGARIRVASDVQRPLASDSLFGRTFHAIDDDGGDPVELGADKYEKSVTLRFTDNTSERLTVVGKTAQIVKQFIANMKYALTKVQAFLSRNPSSSNLITLRAADIVNLALAKTQQDLGMSAKQLRDQLRVEFGTMQISARSWTVTRVAV